MKARHRLILYPIAAVISAAALVTRMRAHARPILYALTALIYAIAIVAAAKAARAHGDAAWIMAEPRYVDANGTHCCGPSDCHREHASKLRETPEGVWFAIGAGDEVLVPRELVGRGLYISIDGGWWACIRGGEVKCLFKPSTGI